MSAAPFFIVSSGRSGTAMLHKALAAVPGVEMHHEYGVQIAQPLAVRRYLGLIDDHETARTLRQTHGAAVHYSPAEHWGDSSNKLSWLIPDLAALFPEARFVHLVRDGRKVASSYFHKLGAECYDDRSNAILQAHYDDPLAAPAPPPEKKYWWPVPRKSDSMAARFR
ncbi:MAG TPA: sulfotransferase, partial [Rhizomicrobium sp.]